MAKEGKMERIKKLLSQHGFEAVVHHEVMETLEAIHTFYGCSKAVQWLLKWASRYGHEKLVAWLLEEDVIQGDHSACGKPPVDFKTEVPLCPG